MKLINLKTGKIINSTQLAYDLVFKKQGYIIKPEEVVDNGDNNRKKRKNNSKNI